MKTYKQINRDLYNRIRKLEDTIQDLSQYKAVVENEGMFNPKVYGEAVLRLAVARDGLQAVANLELTKRIDGLKALGPFDDVPLKSTIEAIVDEALHQSELGNGRIKFT